MRFIEALKSRDGQPIDFEDVAPKIERMCHKHGLLLLYVFGSYAREDSGRLSDLDIAVLPEEEFDFRELTTIVSELIDIFQDEAIDLVDMRKAPLPLIHRVLKEGKCLYARDLNTKIECEVRWENLYLDTAPLRRANFEALERRLQDGTFGSG